MYRNILNSCFLKIAICIVFSLLLLTGCFGGSDETSSSSINVNTSSAITLSGTAYDEPIPNATVKIKLVKSDGSETLLATTTADNNGNWTASVNSANIPDNAALIVEVNGTLNGKQVIFKSIIGKGDRIKNKAKDNNGKLTSDEVPELITSNISTVDYVLALLQKGGNTTSLVNDPEAVLATIKAQKLEVRKRMAAAIKAYLDENATLNTSVVSDNSLTGLVKALVEKSADGDLNSTDIQQIFGTDDFYKVYKAEHDIINDRVLKDVFVKGPATSDINLKDFYNNLINHSFYWKDSPGFYRKLTFDGNGNVQVTFYFYNETSGNWTQISSSQYQNYGLDYDPANWLEKLEYDNNTNKNYLLLKNGEKFEISVLEKSDKAYTLLLTNVSSTPDWDKLLTFQQNNLNIPLVMAYGNNSYASIEDFRSAFRNCTFSLDPTTGILTSSGCFMGNLQLSDNGSIEVVEPSGTGVITTFPIGKWEIDSNINPSILKITFYDPEGTGGNNQVKGNMIIAIYSSSTMGNHDGINLVNINKTQSISTASSTVSLAEGIPIMFFSINTIKLPLFTVEQAVQNFIPPQFVMMENLQENTTQSITSGELPQEAKDMLCSIGNTDQPSSSIDCSSSPIKIIIGTTQYTMGNTGELLDINNNYQGHLMDITPFSFTICWGSTPNNCTSTVTYVNTSKQNEIINKIF